MSHSSGILPSEELRQSFAAASEGGSIRWFKLQIEGSEMGIAAKGDQGESAELDWEGLGGQLEDDVPCFFAFRLDAAKPAEWLLALYVPEVAKVRSKMVYASTRESLKRELGAAFIVSEMHACEKDEMTWPELKRQTQASDADRASVMTNMERMRLVDAPVDTGIKRRSYVHGVKFPLSAEAVAAIVRLGEKSCNFVKLKLEQETESVELDTATTLDGFAAFREEVVRDEVPRFSFYCAAAGGGASGGASASPDALPVEAVPEASAEAEATAGEAGEGAGGGGGGGGGAGGGEGASSEAARVVVVFVYFCPEGAKVRDKMLASTAKAAIQSAAEDLGLVLTHKLEVRDESDLTEADVAEAGDAGDGAAAPPTMTRPKGPAGARRGMGMVKMPGM